MIVEIPEDVLAEAFRLYASGESVLAVAGKLGISNSTLSRRLRAAGIEVRSKGEIMKARAERENVAFLAEFPEAIKRYEEGEPARWVAKEYGIGYKRFIRLLAQAGIQQRTVRENLAMRYAGMTETQRREVASAAHAAKRGRPANLMSMERRAQTMQRTMQLASRFDLLLGLWLAQRGLTLTPQLAVGRYNVDLALDSQRVAVEVNGSGHSTLGEKWDARCEFLFSEGWRIIEVRVKGLISELRPECAESIAALASRTDWGRYTVIAGNGELLPDYTAKRNSRFADPSAPAA